MPLLPFNPCASTRLPRHTQSEIDIFANDEWELFEQLLAERWRPQAEFGLVSMARPGEIGALLVRDVNPVTGAVRINKAWKDGGSHLELGPRKSERGIRTINVPLETLDRLDLTRPADELLFCKYNGNPITAAYFHRNAWQTTLRQPSLRPVTDGKAAVAADVSDLFAYLTDPAAVDREIADVQREATRRITAAEHARTDAEQQSRALARRLEQVVAYEQQATAAATKPRRRCGKTVHPRAHGTAVAGWWYAIPRWLDWSTSARLSPAPAKAALELAATRLATPVRDCLTMSGGTC